MIYGYGLVYAQKFLDSNAKLSRQAQDEVKELLLKEMVEDVCRKFMEVRFKPNTKSELNRLSQRMNRLKKFKMFYRVKYCYKMEYIQEIIFYQYGHVKE